MPRYLPELATTRASAVILGADNGAAGAACAVLRADDPYSAFARAVVAVRAGVGAAAPASIR